jgi:hypothetical protein
LKSDETPHPTPATAPGAAILFPFEENDMAKGQKRSSRELRKPKAPKNKISAAPFITTSQAAKKPAMPAKSKN